MKLVGIPALLLNFFITSAVLAQATSPVELGGLRVPPPGSSGIDTNATFAIGVTTDNGVSWRSSAGAADELRLVGRVRAVAAQSGQAADIYLVVRVGSGYLMRNSSGAFVPWSGKPAELVPYRQQITLTTQNEIDLYTGKLGVSGEFQLFLGYKAADNVLHYSARPFVLTVTAAPPAGSTLSSWFFDGAAWKSNAAAQACPSPLLQAPVDLAKVTSILYPGQTRGGNYKAHGGFRFDAAGQSNKVDVTSAVTGTVFRAVRYIESGVTQYLFDIINPCGVMMRLDHLLELTPKFAAIADTLPPAGSSSATTPVSGYSVSAGETIATAVGVSGNVFMDFGIYDLRSRNPATTNESGELRPYGICWLDALPAADSARVRSLPAADGVAGSSSDYCRQ